MAANPTRSLPHRPTPHNLTRQLPELQLIRRHQKRELFLSVRNIMSSCEVNIPPHKLLANQLTYTSSLHKSPTYHISSCLAKRCHQHKNRRSSGCACICASIRSTTNGAYRPLVTRCGPQTDLWLLTAPCLPSHYSRCPLSAPHQIIHKQTNACADVPWPPFGYSTSIKPSYSVSVFSPLPSSTILLVLPIARLVFYFTLFCKRRFPFFVGWCPISPRVK